MKLKIVISSPSQLRLFRQIVNIICITLETVDAGCGWGCGVVGGGVVLASLFLILPSLKLILMRFLVLHFFFSSFFESKINQC